MPPRYEIRLSDRRGLPAADQFPDVEVSRDGNALLLRGELDQSALHGVLERVRALHLDLLEVRRSRTSTPRPTTCGPPSSMAGPPDPDRCGGDR